MASVLRKMVPSPTPSESVSQAGFDGVVHADASVVEKLFSNYCSTFDSAVKLAAPGGKGSKGSLSVSEVRSFVSGLSAAYHAALRVVAGGSASSNSSVCSVPSSVSSGASGQLRVRQSIARGVFPNGYCFARWLSPDARRKRVSFERAWPKVSELLSCPSADFVPDAQLACMSVKGTGLRVHVSSSYTFESVSALAWLRGAAAAGVWSEGTFGHRLLSGFLPGDVRCSSVSLDVRVGGLSAGTPVDTGLVLRGHAVASHASAVAACVPVLSSVSAPGVLRGSLAALACPSDGSAKVVVGGCADASQGKVWLAELLCSSGEAELSLDCDALVLPRGSAEVVSGCGIVSDGFVVIPRGACGSCDVTVKLKPDLVGCPLWVVGASSSWGLSSSFLTTQSLALAQGARDSVDFAMSSFQSKL